MRTDDEVKRYKDDKEMILRPALWPCWPMLPIKRESRDPKTNWPEVAILIDAEGVKTTVVLSNMYALSEERAFEKAEKIVYNSVDDLLADGWEVD